MELEKIIRLDLNEIIGRDLEQFLDLLEEKCETDGILEDISYQAVGIDNGDILVKVNAKVVQFD
jgi:hypothetical protein